MVRADLRGKWPASVEFTILKKDFVDMSGTFVGDDVLSIVAVSRNDDHGENMKQRMQLFVSNLAEQCERCRWEVELVLVEWNPPPERPRLAEELSWPTPGEWLAIRIIEVPPEIHRRFEHSDRLPLFQMIGKNVGIRRSRGRFVLATNVDILFSDELAKFLAAGSLEPGRLYRIDRYDAPDDIPLDQPALERLTYCSENVLRIHGRDGTSELPDDGEPGSSSNGSPGEKLLSKAKRYVTDENLPKVPGAVSRSLGQLILFGLIKPLGRFIVTGRIGPTRLHTNASGDFTLMAREDWLALRGYVEFEGYSIHLDSLLCYAAHFAGIREEVLEDPMRIYHIEHAPGSGWQPGSGGELMYRRLTEARIPYLTRAGLMRRIAWLRLTRGTVKFNGSDWGLAGENLPETLIGTEMG